MPINVNIEKCTGCRICESICVFAKHREFNLKRSRIKLVKMDRILVDVPIVCLQCKEPSCLKSCSGNAIVIDNNLGIAHVIAEKCTACGFCVDACPVGAITIDPITNVAIKCDLCGGNPLCVKWCPTGALEFRATPRANLGVTNPQAQEKRWKWAEKISRKIRREWGIPNGDYDKWYEKEGRRE